MEAGEASFTTSVIDYNGKPIYHFIGLGSTYPKHDWFFKVHDKYESFADTNSLKPIRFVRDASDGGSYSYDNYFFNQKKGKLYTVQRRDKKSLKIDSLLITDCVNDVVTAIYYVRCLDYSQRKMNETIPVTFVLDGKIYPSYVRFMGREIIDSKLLGKVRCVKLKANLIEGTIFKGGEEMTVWLTDDKNKIPVYVETPIIIGTIKVYLQKYVGLRNKIDCIISK